MNGRKVRACEASDLACFQGDHGNLVTCSVYSTYHVISVLTIRCCTVWCYLRSEVCVQIELECEVVQLCDMCDISTNKDQPLFFSGFEDAAIERLLAEKRIARSKA